MSIATANASVEWPSLAFGPVNLWSLPAAWKRDLQPALPTPAVSHQRCQPRQVNTTIRHLLSFR